MVYVVALLALVLVLVLVLGVVLAARQRRSWLEQRVAEPLVVHTVQGQTYAGLVTKVCPDGLVLTAATLVDTNTDLAGETWIPRGNVLMVQRVKAAG